MFDSGLKASQLVYSKIFYLDFSCSCCLFQSDVRCFLRFGLPPIAPPRMLAIIRGYLLRNKKLAFLPIFLS